MVLENNNIYIVPDNLKKELLLDISKKKILVNIKFYSLKEFISNLTFKYDEKSIYYLMEKYNYKYDNAKIILDNLYYVEDKKYSNEKIDKLVNIKKEIKNLLIYNPVFKEYIKDKKIYIYGYHFIDKFDLRLLSEFDYEIINKKEEDNKHNVYAFNNIFDEVVFVSNKIRELIDKGISINKIKIVSLPMEYSFILKEVFKMQNINIRIDSESIYSSRIVQRFIELFDDDKNIDELVIDNKDEDSVYIYNKIVDVLNKYSFVSNKDIKREILINEFKNIKNTKSFGNEVGVEELDYINDDEYAFILGFNDGNYPKVFKDEDYFTDKEKDILGLSSSIEITNNERNNMINLIRSTKNLIITYKNKSTFNEYYPSTLIKDLGYEVVKNRNDNYNYSNNLNKIKLSMDLDKYVKFLEKSDELSILYSNYKDSNYNSFDNRFKGINKDELHDFIKNKITLSYSSINNFYQCKFKYYLNNVLRLDKFESTFEMFIGNLFHHVLEKCFDEGFDFEKTYNEYLLDKEFNSKEEFFLEKLKKDLLFVISILKKQMTYTSFKNYKYESRYEIDKSTSLTVKFIGFIDKLLINEKNDKTYLIIVDYKTGEPELKLNNSYYGLDMQLPIYLYLSKNSDISNLEVVGFYLQHILSKNIKLDSKKTIESIKEDNLKLQGYTISDEYIISMIDRTYENSNLIKSMSKTSNGFSKNSKLLTKSQMNNLYNLVDKKIDEARDEIINANFEIDPKRIGKDNISCTFCKFKDICFMNEGNVRKLEEVDLNTVLGGEK